MITLTHTTLAGVERIAEFSECMAYRYALWIIWNSAVKPQMFIGLNGSTATHLEDDPTVRRCVDYAQRWGAGGLCMANAAAYRATDPKVMLAYEGDKIGPENTIAYLEKLAAQCQNKPIAAWGKHATKIRWGGHDGLSECKWNRHQELMKFMGPLDCLRLNSDGTPCHPLYLPASLTPIPFNYVAAKK